MLGRFRLWLVAAFLNIILTINLYKFKKDFLWDVFNLWINIFNKVLFLFLYLNFYRFMYLIKAGVFIKLNNKFSRETYRSEPGAFITFVKTEVISVQTAMKLFFIRSLHQLVISKYNLDVLIKYFLNTYLLFGFMVHNFVLFTILNSRNSKKSRGSPS